MSPVDRWGLVVAIVICAVIAGAYALLWFLAFGGDAAVKAEHPTPGCVDSRRRVNP